MSAGQVDPPVARDPPAARRENPYFGLEYYKEQYGAWFFGREDERSKIITNLRAARLTLLHAESGVGKSFLLRAGVASRLREVATEDRKLEIGASDIPVVFSSWTDDPLPKLIDAIEKAIEPFLPEGASRPELPRGGLEAAIRAAAEAANANLLVILDQFEEYFLYSGREPTPERMADELAGCIAKSDLPASFLISIREDAYAGLGDMFKGRIDNVYGNYLHIDYLDLQAAEDAIRKPLEVYNAQEGVQPVTIESELVTAVLRQVRARGDHEVNEQGGHDRADNRSGDGNGNARIATPLLQLVMERVWKREATAWKQGDGTGPRVLHRSTLDELEGVGRIVDAHLAEALDSLDPNQRQTAIELFEYLVTASGGKIAVSIPDLSARIEVDEDEVGGVLRKLDNARIVRSVPAPPGLDSRRFRRYEIFHDVLAQAINRVIAAHRQERLAREKKEADRRAEDERRRARTLRHRLWLACGALGLAVIGIIAAVVALSDANSANAKAKSVQLAANAEGGLTQDPDRSVFLALQGLHVTYTKQADAALRSALPQVQQIRSIQAGTASEAAIFDPANRAEVASVGKDGAASIWNVNTGARVVRLVPKSGFAHNGAAVSVAFNSGGSQVAVGYGLGTISVFDAASGKELRSITVGSPVDGVTFVGTAGILAIATQQGVALVVPGYRCCAVLSKTPATSIAVDPAAKRPTFVVAGSDGTVLLRLHTKPLRAIPTRLGLGNFDAQFSSDGREVVSADGDGKVRIYNVSTRKQVRSLGAGDAAVLSAQFSPDDTTVVAGYASGSARVWNASNGLQLTALAGDTGGVNSARFNADGTRVVTASDDGTVRVWYTTPLEQQGGFAVSPPGRSIGDPVVGAKYSPSGTRLLVVDQEGIGYLYTPGGKLLNAFLPPRGAFVNTAQFNHAGTRLVTADSDGTVGIWDAKGNRMLRTPSIKVGSVANYAAFSPDGSRILVLGQFTAEVVSATTGMRIGKAMTPPDNFSLMSGAFSPAGNLVLTADADGQVEVWDAYTGALIRVVKMAAGAAVNDVEFNHDGSEFVAAAGNGDVQVYASSSGHVARMINACPSPATASFSPNGALVAVACPDGSVPVFDVSNGDLLTALRTPTGGVVSSASFSPNGAGIVATYKGTGGVRLWKTELATASLSRLEQLAAARVTNELTPTERHSYLTSASG